MNKQLYRSFNEEIHRYRNSLLYYARSCEWDKFKAKAGSLFDYCESVEMSETERRFLRVFVVILAVVTTGIALLFGIHPDSPELAGVKKLIMLLAVAGSCYELYFFLNFRLYMDAKAALYNKRRERFISSIEQDFRQKCMYRS